MSIFISIASYRDPETIPTILDAYNKAKNKNDIRFGVLLQEEKNFSKKDLLSTDINLDIIEYDWRESQGTCWARHSIQKLLYNNEDFYFQLDSHHRFCENWDIVLLELFKELSDKCSKPIIGGYCTSYHPNNNIALEDRPMRIHSFPDFDDLGDLMFSPKVIKNYQQLRKDNITHIPARFLSGHFIFSSGSFVKDCLYDPNMYFRGEELTLSARAFTNGYNFFHPLKCVVWHEYLRLDQIKHWNDHTKENGFILTSKDRANSAKKRARHLLGMEKNSTQFGRYGLGKEKSLHEYELFAGLNFSKRLIHKSAYDINSEYLYPYVMNEEDWKAGMMKKYNIELTMPDSYLKNINSKQKYTNSVSLTFYDNKDNIVYRKDIQKKDFLKHYTAILKITGSMQNKPYRVKIIYFNTDKKITGIDSIRSLRIVNG